MHTGRPTPAVGSGRVGRLVFSSQMLHQLKWTSIFGPLDMFDSAQGSSRSGGHRDGGTEAGGSFGDPQGAGGDGGLARRSDGESTGSPVCRACRADRSVEGTAGRANGRIVRGRPAGCQTARAAPLTFTPCGIPSAPCYSEAGFPPHRPGSNTARHNRPDHECSHRPEAVGRGRGCGNASRPAATGGAEGRSDAVSATGTNDSTARKLAPTLAPTRGKSCTSETIPDKSTANRGVSAECGIVAVSSYEDKRKGPLTTAVNGPLKRGRRGSNPQPPDRQSGTPSGNTP